jgi:ketosteroid isomerase-like protein
MTHQNPENAELNKDVVRRFYEAVLTTPGPDFATIKALTDEQEVELNWGHPESGVYFGADIGPARHRMHQLTGLDVTAITIDELIADGPSRVVVVATNSGTDIHNNSWKMTVLELVDVRDGKIVKKRSFYQDTALLRDISLEREQALAAQATGDQDGTTGS